MGKSTINGPFSIAMSAITRGYTLPYRKALSVHFNFMVNQLFLWRFLPEANSSVDICGPWEHHTTSVRLPPHPSVVFGEALVE